MSYRLFDLDEAARYLHLSRADVETLVKDNQIPHQQRGGRLVFGKREIDAWASQRILGMRDRRLTEYHQQSSRGTREITPQEAIMPAMIEPGYIDAAMKAKTKASVLRDMVALAEETGRVNQVRDLLNGLTMREELCSTAMPGGLAILHPRHHEPYMFESSFLVLGRTLQPIYFGASDGDSTELFFLVCCQDDRLHLHTLARLCMMTLKTDMLTRLRQSPDATAIHQCILAAEEEILAKKKRG